MSKLALALGVLVFGASARAASTPNHDVLEAAPIFVGAAFGEAPGQRSAVPELVLGYMTAPEMQAKVARLTGYLHPAFSAFGDVLGRLDPRTGLRTNDRPSLVTVFFMQKIAESVAASVIRREMFMDDEERIVFGGVDLGRSPTDAELANVIDGLFVRWLGTSPGAAAMAATSSAFRRAEAGATPMAGYGAVVALMVRHGGLYYF